MVDVAYPNFQSALSGNEYSYVYALQTSANSIAEKNTGSKVPLQRDTNYFVPPTTTCAAEHGRAAKQLGLKDRFEPSRMRKDDAHALQQLQSAHTGQLHAPSAVSAAQARPHASMLNAGPAATQSNKVSIWAAARSGASQQSQAAAMTDFHLHLQQQHAEERRQMGLSNRVSSCHHSTHSILHVTHPILHVGLLICTQLTCLWHCS